jgi:hypothetical protein
MHQIYAPATARKGKSAGTADIGAQAAPAGWQGCPDFFPARGSDWQLGLCLRWCKRRAARPAFQSWHFSLLPDGLLPRRCDTKERGLTPPLERGTTGDYARTVNIFTCSVLTLLNYIIRKIYLMKIIYVFVKFLLHNSL